MKKCFIILLFFLSFIKVNAYENEFFKIDIPNNYTLTSDTNGLYKWEDKNNYIEISLIKINGYVYNIKDFTDEDIQNQKNAIEKKINSNLSSYNIKADITSIKKSNYEEFYFIEYDLNIPSKEELGFNIYQKGRIYSTNKYLISIILNNEKEKIDAEYDKIINTLVINNSTNISMFNVCLSLCIIIGLIAGIIGYFVSIKKEKK